MLHMYMATLLIGLLLLILLGWQQRKCWQLVWQLNGWLGVAQQPLLWILLCIYLDPKSILDSITRLRPYLRRPIAVIVGTRIVLYIDDPESMESILNAPECLDKTFMQDGFFARRGLLHARGQKWKLRRKQLNPAFSHNIVVSFFDVFNEVGNQLVEQFSNSELLNGDAVKFKDAEDMLSRAVLEVSCLTIMGTTTKLTQSDDAHIATTYKRLLEISALKIVKPWLQIDFLHRWLYPESYKASVECNKLLEQFVEKIVQRKHKEWQSRTRASAGDVHGTDDGHIFGNESDAKDSKDTWQRRIFIEQIFKLAATGELTLQDIMDEAQSMVLVSFETVSNSIIIALLCLAVSREDNGDAQRRLREEIAEILAQGGDIEHIGIEHLQQMPYLDAFLNESLRLLATVPMNLRHVSRDFQLRCSDAMISKENGSINGYNQYTVDGHNNNGTSTATNNSSSGNGGSWSKYVIVPRNSIIVLDTFNMQRDGAWWGSNAQQFEPQRFIQQQEQESEKEKEQHQTHEHEKQGQQHGEQRRHSYSFLPFSKGLRTCIGRRYSFFMMKIFLVKLIAAFEFRTTQKLEQLRFVEGISLKFRNADEIFFQIHKIEQCRQQQQQQNTSHE